MCVRGVWVCGWQMLLDECIDTGVRDSEGLSPAMWACRSDYVKHFDLLTSYQRQQNASRPSGHLSGVDERDLAGRTCLHWSVRRVEPLGCLRVCLRNDVSVWTPPLFCLFVIM